jgi:hypothetical protein
VGAPPVAHYSGRATSPRSSLSAQKSHRPARAITLVQAETAEGHAAAGAHALAAGFERHAVHPSTRKIAATVGTGKRRPVALAWAAIAAR